MTIVGSASSRRCLTLAVTIVAFLTGSLGGVDGAPGASPPTARDSQCKAKCRTAERRKAGRTRYLAAHRYSYFEGTPGMNGTGLTLDLCADGTLDASGTTIVYRTGAYDFSFDGRWSVLSATRWKVRVAYTTANYQANNPSVIPASPPLPVGVLRLWTKTKTGALQILDGGGLLDGSATAKPILQRTLLPTGDACPVVGATAA